MLKSRLYEYLKQYLGEYLYGLEESQLDVALLSGRLNFSNANFKPSKVNELLLSLGLPITLKAGFIGRLHVQYHYLSMLSNPIEVTIDDLFLVLGPILMPATEPAEDRLDTFASDEELSGENSLLQAGNTIETGLSDEELVPEDLSVADLQGIHARMRGKKQSALEQGKWGLRQEILAPTTHTGSLAAYLQRVLKTLTLVVNNFHIRYEDDIYPYQQPFSCGVCLTSLVLKSEQTAASFPYVNSSELASEKPRKEEICKSCAVRSFSVYLNPLSGLLIPTSLWEATLSSPIGIFDALPAYELRDLMLQEAQSACSLLAPISLKAAIRLKEKGVAVSLPLPVLRVQFTAEMMACVRSFQDYVAGVKLWGHIRRYRPCEKIILGLSVGTVPKRKKIVRKWFLYALRFIKCKQKLIQLSTTRPKSTPQTYPLCKSSSVSTAPECSKEKRTLPKWLLDCEAQVRTEGLEVTLVTETAGEVRLAVGHIGVNVALGKRKVSGEVMVGGVEVDMEIQGKHSQLITIGRTKETATSTNGGKRHAQEQAFTCVFTYFPISRRRRALPLPSTLLCDAEGTIGSLSLTYTPSTASQLSSFHLSFSPCPPHALTSKRCGQSPVCSLQSRWIRLANSLDSSLQSSCLSLVFSLGQVSLTLRDAACDSVCELQYASSPLTFIKDRTQSTASALGLSLTTKSTFSLLVSFLTVRYT